jgi:hypothetical protein
VCVVPAIGGYNIYNIYIHSYNVAEVPYQLTGVINLAIPLIIINHYLPLWTHSLSHINQLLSPTPACSCSRRCGHFVPYSRESMLEAVANEGRPLVLRHREDLGLHIAGVSRPSRGRAGLGRRDGHGVCANPFLFIYIYIYIDIYWYIYIYILYYIYTYIYIYIHINVYHTYSRWNSHIHQPTGFLGTIRVRHSGFYVVKNRSLVDSRSS